MSDHITLKGLRARGHHGVFDHEKRDGQDFVVDIVVWTDLGPAAATDDLSMTVDYGALAQQVVDVITGPPFDLIESVASRIADLVFADATVEGVEVTVHKPGAPIPHSFDDVAVTVSRSRET